MGYLSNIRQVNGPNGTFISCVVNGLSGPTDNASYTRFDVTVAGKEASSLINRCQKSVDEDKKVLIGFVLSNPKTDIFTLNSGEHAGEQRVSLKARLIKVDWIKIGQEKVYIRRQLVLPTLRRLSRVPHSNNTRKTLSDDALYASIFRGVFPFLILFPMRIRLWRLAA